MDKPEIHVYRSEIDGRWVVDIEMDLDNGRVYVNAGTLGPVAGKDFTVEELNEWMRESSRHETSI